ncbi:LPS-assembly protein LptD [bioreactor metagenome]|uniref:LPS-assembly protein LptD n=1 Tax=bioreactor metagenome TaxID=1076179 RepID=A0A644V714_9ZZZZ|nr:putative LPS assembly protein LptD [Macellibacteroides fermentans]
MFHKHKILIILFITLLGGLVIRAQEVRVANDSSAPARQDTVSVPKDTVKLTPDSLQIKTDTLMAKDTVRKKKNSLDAVVTYQAKDSILMTAGNWAYLFGEGNVKYRQIELQSEVIEMNMDSSLVFAKFGLDSIGEEFGYPLFKDGEQQYESKTMRYNFGSKKGYITDVITQQGEGYVTAGRTKKMANNDMFMMGGKYTTCDDHDHPHFYIQLSKAKVRPKKNIVTGPAYLVIEDVPLPLAIPFGFFPFSESYSSGIIMPTFGDEMDRGFFLRDGGYYFALSDYVDLALTGEIYTKGSWGLSARSAYRKRYKYSGNFNASLLTTILGDKVVPQEYSKSKDFKITWTHSQDAKANPYRNFTASVNFATSSYDRNQLTNIYNPNSTSNTKGSSVSLSQRFPNSPFSLSATMNVNQRSRDSSISVTLPDVSVTMSRIYPFKRKHAVGSEKWFEKISMSYSGYLRNSIDTKENKLMHSSLVKDWRNGMQHNIPISATFNLFKYINISPSFNYTERWYTSKIMQEFNETSKRLMPLDTIYGFNRVYNYNASLSASTTMYGFYKPLPFLGNKVEMIRHRFEPSISLSAAPDFGDPRYGFYESYTYMDQDGEMYTNTYSPYSNQIFGSAPQGKQGSLSFSINNNVEMKIRSDEDSTGFKKISLIDKLSLAMSYNMAADSFKWSDMSVGLRLKFSKSYTLNLNAMFDTYTYDERGRKVNVPRWEAGKGFGRLRSTGTNFSYTLNNETFSKLFGGGKTDETKKEGSQQGTGEEGELADGLNPETDAQPAEGGRLREKKKELGEFDADGYQANKVPWSLAFSYGMNLGYGDFNPNTLEYKYKLTHNLSFNGNIQPTKNWRFNFNATYDFDTKKIAYMNCSVTRDLHCWQMSGSFIPIGPYKSYTFTIAVSSSLLKDLKYNQSSSYREGQQWY